MVKPAKGDGGKNKSAKVVVEEISQLRVVMEKKSQLSSQNS